MMRIMKTTHGINFILKEHVDNLRPETNTLIIPTSIKNTQARSLTEIKHIGIEHIALLLIFPYDQNNNGRWKGCVVHHPHQDKQDMEDEYTSIINKTPTHMSNNIDISYIPGVMPKECEAGLLMWFYIYIGHRSRSLNFFQGVIHNIDESELIRNIREWLHTIYHEETSQTSYVPNWVDLLFTNNCNND